MRLLENTLAAIRKHRLAGRGARVLVAVSGGADSMALLHVMLDAARVLKLELAAAHFEHGIRGRASRRDAAFVREAVRKLGLKCVVGRGNVPALAKKRKISLEMAAREARYDFFAKAARRTGCRAIATAHTADDQAETILLKLARGAGARGLSGIAPRTEFQGLTAIHPLLAVSRAEILAYLRRKKIAWREDASNRDRSFLRNRVRHRVLPFLDRQFGKGVRRALARGAEILREEDAWMDSFCRGVLDSAGRGLPSGWVSVRRLARSPAAVRRRVIRLWLSESGVPPEDIDFGLVERIESLALRRGASGETLVARGRAVRREGGSLVVAARTPLAPRAYRIRIAAPGETFLKSAGVCVAARHTRGIGRERGVAGILPASATLGLGALRGRALYARTWRRGDRMQPFGMTGSKKVGDIFTDAKLPVSERRRVPIFECGGEIVWIPGYRIARGWEVESESAPALRLDVRRSVPSRG